MAHSHSSAIVSKGLNELDFLCFDEPQIFGTWEQPYFYGGENINLLSEPPALLDIAPYSLPQITNTSSNIDIYDFDQEHLDFGLWDFNLPPFENEVNVPNPQTMIMPQHDHIMPNDTYLIDQSQNVCTTMHNPSVVSSNTRRNVRYKSSTLELEEIQNYFDVPITKAAKELNVGLTVLKKRCRELNIMRWPHRKIKSLKSLIRNVKEMGLTNELGMLEEHKRMVEKVPEMELSERTKKLRQACFKANYKKRRSMMMQQQQQSQAAL